jgi:hypothetical protein
MDAARELEIARVQRGVEHAIGILTGEITRTLQLPGFAGPERLRQAHVRPCISG